MIRKLALGFSFAAVFALGTAAIAHDFFLLPDQFQTKKQGPLRIQATVGSAFPTPEAVVAADRVERLAAIGPGNPQIKVVGAGAKSLNLDLTGAKSGVTVIGVASKPRDVEYAEDRIPLILEEYRVAPQAAAAVEALTRPRTWLVSSRRFAKTFFACKLAEIARLSSACSQRIWNSLARTLQQAISACSRTANHCRTIRWISPAPTASACISPPTNEVMFICRRHPGERSCFSRRSSNLRWAKDALPST